jgi:hypothetical protein
MSQTEEENASFFEKYNEKWGVYNGFDFNVGGKLHNVWEEDLGRSLYGLLFQTRYQFFSPTDAFSLSVDVPASLGFDFFSSNAGNFYGFFGEAPLAIDLNIGAGATSESNYVFGVFLGSGISYSFNRFGVNDLNKTIHLFGPYFQGGVRWRQGGFTQGIMVNYSFALPAPSQEVNGIVINSEVTKQSVGISFLYWF